MRNFFLLLSVIISASAFAQQTEVDTIYRLKYKNSYEMVFGKGVNVRTYDVEFYSFDEPVIAKKSEIDYIKTPNGYIIFNPPKAEIIKRQRNKSWRIIIGAAAHLNNTQKIFWAGNYDERKFEFHGSGFLEADFELLQGFPFQKIIDFKLGFGTEYVIPRTGETISGKLGFFNAFASVKLTILKEEMFSPSGIARLGYGYPFGNKQYKSGMDFEGAKYFAFGGGLTALKRVFVFCLYSFNKAYIMHPLEKMELHFERLDVGLGIVF